MVPLKTRLALATVLLGLLAGCTVGPPDSPGSPGQSAPGDQPAAGLTLAADQILTVDQIKPGMTGYGLTVFSGSRPQRFDVEVISVLTNYDPQSDMILIRCSGQNLEKTGIASGMSGSPIYVNNKLIGALAYGWRFTTEPIAGVQPIAQMLRNSGLRNDLPPATQDDRPDLVAGPARLDRLAQATGRSAGKTTADTHAANLAGTELRPLTTPLMVSGGSRLAMEFLRKELAGTNLVPLRSGGVGAADPRLDQARIEPGGTVCIPLLAGDMDISALGTVTAVLGDRVLAFGHPMFNEGPVNMPMATGVVHTFIPSMLSSFKMGSAGPVVGAIRRDESASILGVTGQVPFMTPMTVRVTTWEGSTKTYRYQVADDWFFTGLLAGYAAISSATADHGEPVDLTVYYSGQVKFRGFEPFRFEGVASSVYQVAWRLDGPIEAMLNSRWGKALVESIDLEMRTVNEDRSAQIEHFRLAQPVLAPGEPAVIHLTLEPYRKPRVERTIRIDLPADLPDGQYELALLDADDYRYLLRDHDPQSFTPRNMAQLLAGYNRLAQPRNDHLYAVLTLPSGGLATANHKLPALPASRALMLRQAGRDELMTFTRHQVWPEPMDSVVSGSNRFQITIDRNKHKKP